MPTVKGIRSFKLSEVQVFRRLDLTPDLMLMWLDRPADFTFKPGQYCTIGLNGVERPYSIVSAPHEEFLELFLELVPPPDGVLTPMLWDLHAGDSVTIRPKAKGLFTMDRSIPVQFMVATVTGIAPYLSILRDYLHHGYDGNRFYVLMGASYADEFAYEQELADLARLYPELVTFVPTVSRPQEERNSGWTGETGRVNLIVERHLDRLGPPHEDTLVYACGHPDMIEDVKTRMAVRDFAVKEERFWKE